MARFENPTAAQECEWREWVAGRPESVREIAERFDPWALYRMHSTGQRVQLVSIFEDGTVSVAVFGEFNLVAFERRVFGIDPNDLEECDLPGPDELCGEMVFLDCSP